jgi:hypothetical protein
MISWLPPQWQEGGEGVHSASFRLTQVASKSFELDLNGALVSNLTLEDAIDDYERALRNHIATAAPPEHLFIHAGAVAHNGRAIIIPGPSFSGKTTLVSALVERGAVYYSDEYAVVDPDGLVHAYPKPISVRQAGHREPKLHQLAESLGATIGDVPAQLGMVVSTQYRSDATWNPVELTPGQAALELVQHSRAPEDRAASTLSTLAHAVDGVLTLKGPRGDAGETAVALLARLEETGR